MNTSYDFNSTPKANNGNKYIDSLMDFSTPMSTISSRWNNNVNKKNVKQHDEKLSLNYSHNSTVVDETIIDMNNNNESIVDKLLQKFNEHKNNFHHTQNCLNLLDGHLREITIVLNQLQNSLDHDSLLKPTADQLETRLLQISSKREQIRATINSFHPSPSITQTLNDMIQQISPSTSKRTSTTDPAVYYTELINVVKLTMSQKSSLIERFDHEQKHVKHRTNDYHSKIQQRQQLLLRLVERILEQQKQNEKYIETINIDNPQFDHHTVQLAEFNRLIEEYQSLQDENRLLKQQAKENIKALYTFINQTTE